MTNRIILAITLLLGTGNACLLKATTFSDANWVSPGSANGTVYATAVDGSGNLYIGGSFTAVGGVNATNIAKWDGTNWSALSPGPKGTVSALAALGSNVYAGGSFSTGDGSPGNYISQWNGSSWSPMGSGMNATVYAIAVTSNHVYAGGDFNTAGGTTARNVAAWNGFSWSAMGPAPYLGMNGGPVFGLATSGNDLYAVGAFATAGGLQCNGISRFISNGDYWAPLGSPQGLGMNNWVTCVAVSSNYVYAGGFFGSAGGVTVNAIARYDGNQWSALGTGTGGNVFALAVSDTNLYVGGGFYFPDANGKSANYIARWNGSSWAALGSGLDTSVSALTVSGSDLYAGGSFSTAGGKASAYVARAALGDVPGYNQLTGTPLPGGDVQLSYIGYPATNYALDRAFNLAAPIGWVAQRTNTMSPSGVLLFTNTPQPGTNNFWRIRSVP